MLTYPRTDSRALPEDYLGVAKKTMAMLADETLPGPLRDLGFRLMNGVPPHERNTGMVFQNYALGLTP